jgi:hypothetical protein
MTSYKAEYDKLGKLCQGLSEDSPIKEFFRRYRKFYKKYEPLVGGVKKEESKERIE